MLRTISFQIAVLLMVFVSGIVQGQTPSFKGKDASYWTERLTKKESSENLQNRTRWYAAYALGEIGPAAAVAVTPLMERLLDTQEYEYTRGTCAWALGRIGDDKAIDALTEAMDSKMEAVKISSAQSLGLFEQKAQTSADKLADLLTGKSEAESDSTDGTEKTSVQELSLPVKAAVSAALWKISPADSENAKLGQQTLLSMIKANSTRSRLAALSELVLLSNQPDKDISSIYKTMVFLLEKTSNDDVARDCGQILMNRQQSALIEPLLKNDNAIVRRRALRTLCLADTVSVELVLPLMEDENPAVRAWAVRALGKSMSNPDAESAVVKAVEDNDLFVKKAARKALKK